MYNRIILIGTIVAPEILYDVKGQYDYAKFLLAVPRTDKAVPKVDYFSCFLFAERIIEKAKDDLVPDRLVWIEGQLRQDLREQKRLIYVGVESLLFMDALQLPVGRGLSQKRSTWEEPIKA
jgi:single-stranded DNA-binding protein